MALIDSTSLLRIADRAAMQYKYLYDAFAQLTTEGGGYYATIVTDTDDNDVEIPLQSPYHYVDENLGVDYTVRCGTQLPSILGAMDTHFSQRDLSGTALQDGGWDGYLTDADERVSYYFNLLYYATRRVQMLANNVFSESDDNFGSVAIGAGPAIVFTDGVNYGTGAATNRADGSNYAATQLKVRVGSMGATDADLRLSVKDVNNDLTTIDVTVPGGSSAGAEVEVGTSSDRFLDVTAVAFVPASHTGTVGDTFTIRNRKERQIAL